MILALWTWLCPELTLLASKAERSAAFRKANEVDHWIVGTVRVLFLMGAPTIIGYLLVCFGPHWDLIILGLPLAPLFGVPMGLWIESRILRRRLPKILREYGIVLCLRCGYDLRGQAKPRCPECGTPFSRPLLTPPNEPAPDDK